VKIDPSVVVEKEIAVAVEVFTEAPTVTDPHGEHVDSVTVAMRGEVDAPFVVLPDHVAPVPVDAVRDVETVVAERTFVPERTMVVTVELSVMPVMRVMTLMSVLDPVPWWVPTVIRFGR